MRAVAREWRMPPNHAAGAVLVPLLEMLHRHALRACCLGLQSTAAVPAAAAAVAPRSRLHMAKPGMTLHSNVCSQCGVAQHTQQQQPAAAHAGASYDNQHAATGGYGLRNGSHSKESRPVLPQMRFNLYWSTACKVKQNNKASLPGMQSWWPPGRWAASKR